MAARGAGGRGAGGPGGGAGGRGYRHKLSPIPNSQ